MVCRCHTPYPESALYLERLLGCTIELQTGAAVILTIWGTV